MNIKVTKQTYANAADPHVSALTGNRYRFEKLDSAVKKIEYFKGRFTAAREGALEGVPEGKNCLVMWIADFDVTIEEEEKGYMGNYAFIAPEELPSGIVTLACVKLEVDSKFHPRRKREKQRLPNWGHPILRAIKKDRIYKTVESAQAQLESLHLEFPEVTIPSNNNKLYIMIFDRKLDPEKPAQKYVLEIETHADGGFIFKYGLNEHKPKITIKRDNDKSEAGMTAKDPLPPQGYFTSMVALKAKKKSGGDKKPAAKKPTPQAAAEPASSEQTGSNDETI